MKEFSELQILEDFNTKMQNVKIYVDPQDKLVLSLDTYVQFKEGEDEQIYHSHLIDLVMDKHQSAKKFLILGGGDGLCSRNILKNRKDAQITLIDYDEELISFCKTYSRIKNLNESSLEMCNIIHEDASEWVKKQEQKYDIIIFDLPDPNYEPLEKLYEAEFYGDSFALLENDGWVSMQVHPERLDKTMKILAPMLKTIIPIKFSMPWLTEGAVIIGQKCQQN